MPFDSHQPEHDQASASMLNVDAGAVPSKLELSELELGLPDDLQLLAEQLGEDALHLAALYPAHASQQWQTSALEQAVSSHTGSSAEVTIENKLVKFRKLTGSWIRPALVAASLLLAVTLAWQVVPKSSPHEPAPVLTTQTELKPALPISQDHIENPSQDELLTYHPVVDQPAESNRVIGTVKTEQAMVPAGLFMTLSGPEQEAMLDLIEDAKLQQPSVSF